MQADTSKYMQYSDEDKASALILLATNRGNVARTARALHIPRSALKDWAEGRKINRAVAELRHIQGHQLADLFEEVVWMMLASLTPEKLEKATALQLMKGAEIAVDKMLLLRGCKSEGK